MAKPTLQQSLAIENLMVRWQEANAADVLARYGQLVNQNVTRADVGKKFFHLVIGTSSAFLVDIATGIIYGNKGWLKIDRKKIVGNAYDPNFDPAALVRDRFRYGHFENNPDGSLRQPIVRR
jgi:hypothetical protein